MWKPPRVQGNKTFADITCEWFLPGEVSSAAVGVVLPVLVEGDEAAEAERLLERQEERHGGVAQGQGVQ